MAAVGLSILGFTGYYLLLAFAIRDAGTEVPTLIIGTIPIWIMLLGKPGHLRWGALVPGILLTTRGKALESGAEPSNIIDQGYPLGAINLAGQTPLILINDGPSTGGFINPFTVPSAAFWKLGQARPGFVLYRCCRASGLVCRIRNSQDLGVGVERISDSTVHWQSIECATVWI